MADDDPPAFPAGWYAAPEQPGQERWFDGSAWTDSIRPTPATAARTRSVRKRVAWGLGLGVAGVGLSIIVIAGVAGLAGAGQSPTLTAAHHSASAPARTPTSITPSPTPTPTAVVPDLSTASLTSGGASLGGSDLTVAFVQADGSAVTDPTGWTIVSQSPAAGVSVPQGSTVTLTLAPPPPPPPPAPAPPVQAPAPAPAPAVPAPGVGATAQCKDGTLSYSAHHQGTCSHHGGVAVWYK